MTKLAVQFGKAVQARRKLRSMTQAQLAEATELSEEWIRRIERGVGSPSLDAIEVLAKALDCNVAELFSTMTTRDVANVRIGALLDNTPVAELSWVEDLIRVAIRRP